MKQASRPRAVRTSFTFVNTMWHASLAASCLLGVLLMAACDQAATPAKSIKKNRQYKVLKVEDKGNHVRNYLILSRAYSNIMDRNLKGLTSQQRARNRAIQDSLSRLPSSPERDNQIAQLFGFESAQAQRELRDKSFAEYRAAKRFSPAFFRKSWPEKRKWLLLAYGSASQDTHRAD